MKSIIVMMLALAGTAAKAEIIKCSFTEPFVDITYSTNTRQVQIDNVSEQKKSVVNNVAFLIAGPNLFSLRNAQGKEVARLELNNQGSDGMSNNIYPYSVTTSLVDGANSGIGGCSSELLPAQRQPGD